jgi:hypothetical protein
MAWHNPIQSEPEQFSEKRRQLKLFTCAIYTKSCDHTLHIKLGTGAVSYKEERAQSLSLPHSLSISSLHTGNIPNTGTKVITSILFLLMWCWVEFLALPTRQ